MSTSDELLEYISEVEELGDSVAEGRVKRIEFSADAAFTIIAAVALIAVVAAELVCDLIVRGVTSPIAVSVGVVERIGQSVFPGEIPVPVGKDRAAGLLRASSSMQGVLRGKDGTRS